MHKTSKHNLITETYMLHTLDYLKYVNVKVTYFVTHISFKELYDNGYIQLAFLYITFSYIVMTNWMFIVNIVILLGFKIDHKYQVAYNTYECFSIRFF